MENRKIVFTKPWKLASGPELADLVADLGFTGVELPVRPEYQVTPHTVTDTLPKIAKDLSQQGVSIVSVAADPTQEIIEACGAAGIEMIRTMVRIDMKKGYRASVDEAKRLFCSMTPHLLSNGVKLGVQNHCDYFVGSAIGLMDLLAPLDPRAIGAVLDFAHCALDGEPVDMAIDIIYDRLFLANFKSAYRRRKNGMNTDEGQYEIYWTTAQHATYSWQQTVSILSNRGYTGAMCIPAEYSVPEGGSFLEEEDVLPFVRFDLEYLGRICDSSGRKPL